MKKKLLFQLDAPITKAVDEVNTTKFMDVYLPQVGMKKRSAQFIFSYGFSYADPQGLQIFGFLKNTIATLIGDITTSPGGGRFIANRVVSEQFGTSASANFGGADAGNSLKPVGKLFPKVIFFGGDVSSPFSIGAKFNTTPTNQNVTLEYFLLELIQ